MTFSAVRRALLFCAAPILFGCGHLCAQSPFQFPTANHNLYVVGSESKFFVPTATDKPPSSGSFGCVRSDGWQMHEGLDIRCEERDKRGEPTDPVLATADGTVVYINTRPSLSNYGNYIILRHVIDGVEIYSLYAHLWEVRAGLKAGQAVKAGEPIATMGRTSNTAQSITKERAHVHFELDLFINEHFSGWFQKTAPGERNDHGIWNGQNLIGIDPSTVLITEHSPVKKFNLLEHLRGSTELYRVCVRATSFPFLKRYPSLVLKNPVAEKEGTAGYEIAFDFNGVPFALMPRAASEIKGTAKIQLLSVNEAEQKRNPCRKFIVKRGSHWQLTDAGQRLISLLTY